MSKYYLILMTGLLSLWMQCSTSTEPMPTAGTVTGAVKAASHGEAVYPAYIFIADSLSAVTDSFGNYTIPALLEGAVLLTCSASGYHDTTEQVQLLGGKTITHDFFLTPDSSTGRVYGEFHDTALYALSLETQPEMINWDAQEIFEGVTGATIQSKTLRRQAPERRIFWGDSLLAVSDDFGQFWLQMPSGACALKGVCEGYAGVTQVVRVMPKGRVYVNFFLTPESVH